MNGIYMLGLPEDTMKVVVMLAKKLGRSHADVIADSIALLAKAKLTPEDARKTD